MIISYLLGFWGVFMRNSKKDDFEGLGSIYDSDDYTMEQVCRNELIKLSKKSSNLMKVADDLIRSNHKFSKTSIENQSLTEKIHFSDDMEMYLENINEQLRNDLERLQSFCEED